MIWIAAGSSGPRHAFRLELGSRGSQTATRLAQHPACLHDGAPRSLLGVGRGSQLVEERSGGDAPTSPLASRRGYLVPRARGQWSIPLDSDDSAREP